MWTRKELKSKAKTAIKKNYWAAVAVCFIIAILTSSYNSSTIAIDNYSSNKNISNKVVTISKHIKNTDIIKEFFDYSKDIDKKVEKSLSDAVDDITYDFSPALRVTKAIKDIFEKKELINSITLILSAVITIIFIVFIQSILQIGKVSFFIENSKKKNIKISTILNGFKNNYMTNVKTMLRQSIYLFLWTFTIVMIPIKLYEYKMIPYILATNKNLTSKEVINLSKKMMQGNKWNTFILDLSFIGWEILILCSLGILGIFFVNPYKEQTYAELYNTLNKKGIA